MRKVTNQKQKVGTSIYAFVILLLVMSVGYFATTPTQAIAQSSDGATYSEYIPLAPLPYTSNGGYTDATNQNSGKPCNPNAASGAADECKTNFLFYLRGLFQLMVALSAALAIVYIAYGGFQYVLSATEMGKTGGKETIQRALTGLIVVLCSYLIIYTINPELVKLQFSADKIKSASLQESSLFLSDPVTASELEAKKRQYRQDRANLDIEKKELEKKLAAFDPSEFDDPEVLAKYDALIAEKKALSQKEVNLVTGRVDVLRKEANLAQKQILDDIANTQNYDEAAKKVHAVMEAHGMTYNEAARDARLLGGEEPEQLEADRKALAAVVAKALDCRQKFPKNTAQRPTGQVQQGYSSGPFANPVTIATTEEYYPYNDCMGIK